MDNPVKCGEWTVSRELLNTIALFTRERERSKRKDKGEGTNHAHLD